MSDGRGATWSNVPGHSRVTEAAGRMHLDPGVSGGAGARIDMAGNLWTAERVSSPSPAGSDPGDTQEPVSLELEYLAGSRAVPLPDSRGGPVLGAVGETWSRGGPVPGEEHPEGHEWHPPIPDTLAKSEEQENPPNSVLDVLQWFQNLGKGGRDQEVEASVSEEPWGGWGKSATGETVLSGDALLDTAPAQDCVYLF